MAEVMVPFRLFALACAGCGTLGTLIPFEDDEYREVRFLEPEHLRGSVQSFQYEGWSVTDASAVCMSCRVVADPEMYPTTGPLVPVPAWIPVCSGPDCGRQGFWEDEDGDERPLDTSSPALDEMTMEILADNGWVTLGQLRCPDCVALEGQRVVQHLDLLGEYAGMDALPGLEQEVHRG